MKKLLFAVPFFLLSGYAESQDYPEEFKRIIAYAVELRHPDSDESVFAKMVNDNCWTLMDEIKLHSAESSECSLAEEFEMKRKMQMFGINDLAYKAEQETEGRYASAGNFCNGTDPRYNFSFIEKTIASGMTSRYEIPQRDGRQIFAILPFFKENKLYASISYGGNDYTGVTDRDGHIIIDTGAGDKSKGNIILSVSNGSKKDVSYIIINYNSRSSNN